MRVRESSSPEQFHLQALTEQYVTLSRHTALRGFGSGPLRERPLSGGEAIPPGFPVDPNHHLAASPTLLHPHYRGFNATTGRSAISGCIPISHFAVHAYSFSVGITLRLPKFCTQARNRFLPPLRRIPRSLYTGARRVCPRRSGSPWFWNHLTRFRRFIDGSLAFNSLFHT